MKSLRAVIVMSERQFRAGAGGVQALSYQAYRACVAILGCVSKQQKVNS